MRLMTTAVGGITGSKLRQTYSHKYNNKYKNKSKYKSKSSYWCSSSCPYVGGHRACVCSRKITHSQGLCITYKHYRQRQRPCTLIVTHHHRCIVHKCFSGSHPNDCKHRFVNDMCLVESSWGLTMQLW